MADLNQDESIESLMNRVYQLPWGRDMLQLLEQVIALAIESGDKAVEFEAKSLVTSCALEIGDNDLMLSSFTWCMGLYESDRQLFTFSKRLNTNALLWRYKWIVPYLDRYPSFSLQQAEDLLSDMESHYKRAGLGRSGVISTRLKHALHVGDDAATSYWHSALIEIPRDSHSDCQACYIALLADVARSRGDTEEALRLLDEMRTKNLRCREEPRTAQNLALVDLVLVGRIDEAKRHVARTYGTYRLTPKYISRLAEHLEFWVVAGNLTRAKQLMSDHLAWLTDRITSDSARLEFLASTCLTLRALDLADRGNQVIEPAARPELASYFEAAAPKYSAASLFEPALAAAETLARAFDQRNGNTFRSDRLAKIWRRADGVGVPEGTR
ncbi:MAG: hypothetical protein LBJ62_01460 [Bifidobacteriaceae bacterium]|jgi:hypothetical protein|nr:hypothetical protein [Bifidobacteriaceae bacterium]